MHNKLQYVIDRLVGENEHEPVEIDVNRNTPFELDSIMATVSVREWLEHRCGFEVDEQTILLQALFEAIADSKDYTKSWHQEAIEFIELLDGEENPIRYNSYGSEDNLSNIIQFVASNEYPIAILQVHRGGDVRGGYSYPWVVKGDWYELAGTPRGIYGRCSCAEYSNEDGSVDWHVSYDRLVEKQQKRQAALPEITPAGLPKPAIDELWDMRPEENKVICTRCGEEVNFSA